MSKHISIHKAEYHKAFHVNQEDNEEFIDDILSVEKFVYPVKDKNSIYQFDVKNEKLISDNCDLKSFKINASTETISYTGIPLEKAAKIAIPKKTKRISFEGGNLMALEMAKTHEGDAIWKKVINLINLYKFNITTDERILLEEELRSIYNKEIPLYITDTGLSNFFEKIESSKITELTVGWVHFTEFDFKILSKLKQLQGLRLMYFYNDRIKWLPINLSHLSIYGTTIQSLSEINLNLPNLVELDLSGNTLENLDSLSVLPENLDDLDLSRNLIRGFKISDLPENLEYLNLSNNLIENDCFDQGTVHKNLHYLLLSNNNLNISTSVLHRILEIFPNLEYLELLDNKTDGVPFQFLGDIENKNCLARVQYLLEGIEFKHQEGEIIISNEKNLSQFIKVFWTDSSLPVNVILSDIQYSFAKHLKEIPSFVQFQNGFYCFIEHDNCEIYLKINEELKEVVFQVQSDTAETVATYFHKYLHEINSLITLNSHKNILPSIEVSKSCKFLKAFYCKAFKIDYRVKSDIVLKPSISNIELLINNRTIETPESSEEGKFARTDYEDINNVVFILISGKSAYPFVVKNNMLTNSSTINKNFYYYLILRTSNDKENYIKGLTNRYLNDSGLAETELFIDNDLKKKVSCFINRKYLYSNNGVLSVINPVLKLDNNNLLNVKMDNGKWCEFKSENNFIEMKYI